jgi:hypothetical protein
MAKVNKPDIEVITNNNISEKAFERIIPIIPHIEHIVPNNENIIFLIIISNN